VAARARSRLPAGVSASAQLRSKGRAWAIPSPLAGHLRDLRVGDFQSVLDGIAAAVQRALQADAVVSVAGYFLLPSVRFVDDYFQFFYCQGGLRDQAPLLSVHERWVM